MFQQCIHGRKSSLLLNHQHSKWLTNYILSSWDWAMPPKTAAQRMQLYRQRLSEEAKDKVKEKNKEQQKRCRKKWTLQRRKSESVKSTERKSLSRKRNKTWTILCSWLCWSVLHWSSSWRWKEIGVLFNEISSSNVWRWRAAFLLAKKRWFWPSLSHKCVLWASWTPRLWKVHMLICEGYSGQVFNSKIKDLRNLQKQEDFLLHLPWWTRNRSLKTGRLFDHIKFKLWWTKLLKFTGFIKFLFDQTAKPHENGCQCSSQCAMQSRRILAEVVVMMDN